MNRVHNSVVPRGCNEQKHGKKSRLGAVTWLCTAGWITRDVAFALQPPLCKGGVFRGERASVEGVSDPATVMESKH